MSQNAAQRPRLGLGTKLAYGFGSAAYGIKDHGFSYFVLIFYSQVLGVSAPLVGLALLIALAVDAISDPLIGYLSDNTHSRLGRRHPYMYGAIIPVTAAYYFLWVPPAGLTGDELFPYLVVLSIVIRLLITMYEVPCTTLTPELTDDYDERTSLLSYRLFFGWIGGTGVAVIGLTFFLVETDEISQGLMNISGYGSYGLMAAGLMMVSMLTASLGTHRFIPFLKQPPPKQKLTARRMFSEIKETLSDKSFIALFLAAIMGAIATGLAAGLNYYISGFFWEFNTDQIAGLSVSVILSALIALAIAPRISRRLGKKNGAIVVGIIAFSTAPLPVALRLFGLMPENGDPVLYPLILIFLVLDLALIIVVQILVQSMIADLVESSELRTNRRSEGVFFSAVTFTRKASQGFGVLAASGVLWFAEFPEGLSPGDVPADALFKLGAWYAPSLFCIWMLMIFFVRSYKIDRATHEANVAALAELNGGNATGEATDTPPFNL